MRRMAIRSAYRLARKSWGASAIVCETLGGTGQPYRVGTRNRLLRIIRWFGLGKSWEAAFVDAGVKLPAPRPKKAAAGTDSVSG